MDVRVRKLLTAQDGVVAWRQLVALGLSKDVASRVVRDWTELHDGVWFAGFSEPTKEQRWRAATLSAPRSVLSHASAADFYGLRQQPGGVPTITRPGRSGKQLVGARSAGPLLVHYSTTLNGNVVKRHGFWVTTVERTIIDLSPHLADHERRKLLREALRLRKVTIASMTAALVTHEGRRGTVALKTLVARYARLRLDRCRSDAEAYALEILDEAGLALPEVNVDIAGEEPDLSWAELNLIIEIDGPGFHVLKDEDARKTSVWTQAGQRVRRISSDTVFATPRELVELARRNGVTTA